MWFELWRQRWFGKNQNRKARRGARSRLRRITAPSIEHLEDRALLTLTLTVGNGATSALISDIHTANSTTNQPVIISLASNGTYELGVVNNTTNGPNALPVITAKNLTINGNGATLERVQSIVPPKSQGLRLLDVGKGANVTFENLTIKGGDLVGQVPQTPAAPGANVLPSRTGTEGAKAGGGANAANGGDADGGAMYATGATIVLSNVHFTANTVKGAAGGVGGFGGNGGPGSSGAAGTQGHPAGYPGQKGSSGGKGGTAGNGGNAYGGAMYITATKLTLENNTSFTGNVAQGGTGGVGGFGGFGGSGGAGGAGFTQDPQGGAGGAGKTGGKGGGAGVGGVGGQAAGAGLYALNSTVSVVQGTMTNNAAIGGQGGIGGFGGGGGPGGNGGAGGQPLSPWAQQGPGGFPGIGGDGGAGGKGGVGGNAMAAGIYTVGGSLKLLTANITSNKVVPGAAGPGGPGGAGGTGGQGGPGNPSGDANFAGFVMGVAGKGGASGTPGTASNNANIVRAQATAPLFVSSSSFTFTAGQSNTFVISTHGYPLAALSESGVLPKGVTFTDNGNGTATLSGKPATSAAGSYTLTFKATNGVSPNATQAFTLVVQHGPSISSPNSTTFNVGQTSSFAINTIGYPIATLTESGALPAGVSFTDNGNGTGSLSGTPLPGSGGTYQFTIGAQNGLQPNGSQTFTLTVDEAPRITSNAGAVFNPSNKDTFTITTLGFPLPTLTKSGTLPAGVTFTANSNGTATLSGTPAAGTGGFYHFTITAHNSSGSNASQNFTLLVGQAPVFTGGNQSYFTAGQTSTFKITTTGSPTAAISESGTLPSGFSFTDNGGGTATLTGAPTAGTIGSYTIDLVANNGITTTQQLTINVGQPPTFTSANVATFMVGKSGSFTISTSGTGVSLQPQYALPDGLIFTYTGTGDNFESTATISGTPLSDAAGSQDFTLMASNNFGTASQDLTLNIGQGLAITTADNGSLTVGQKGSLTIATASSSGTVTLKESGTLPKGVTFTDNGNGTATLGGTPDAGTSNTYEIAITAHNGTSPNFVQDFTLTIDGAPHITSAASTTFALGSDSFFDISTNGLPDATVTEAGALPTGVTFSAFSFEGTAELSGTPAAGTAGTYNITLTAKNGVGTAAQQSFTLYVGDFTSKSSTTFTVGTKGSFNVTTTGFPASASLSIPEFYLPSGVSFTDNGNGTATISGTPDADSSSTYTVPISVMVDSDTVDTQNLVVSVDDAPQIESSNSDSFIANASNSFTVTTYGLPAPKLTESGTLPSGVTFKDNGDGTATISGMPPTTAKGNYDLKITAHNGLGSDNVQDFTLTVGTGVVFTDTHIDNYSSFVIGQNNSVTFTTAGNPTAVLTEQGALPSGVTFNDNGNGTATLSGKPASGSKNEYTLSISANDGVDPAINGFFDLYVYAPTKITSSASTGFAVGSSGSFTVTTTSDQNLSKPTLTESGTLPQGVSFEDNGDGTAAITTFGGILDAGSVGTFKFTITASEGGLVPDVTQSFTLTVGQAPAITSGNSTSFAVGQKGSFSITSTGSPVSALSESGTLPSGISFKDNGNGTATLSGTAATGTAGTYPITLTAKNGVGSNFTQTFTLTVGQAPAITNENAATFSVGQKGTFTFTSTGTPTPTLTESGEYPSGLTFTANNNGTATFSGTPVAGTGGFWTITVTASNGISPSASQTFTLNVDAAPQITSSASTVFAAGVENTFAVTTYSFPVPKLAETGALPSGVTFTDNQDHTATLSGKPSAGASGVYPFTITAQNGIGSNASQNFVLVVGVAPTITSTDITDFGVGQSGSFTLTSTGTPFATFTESGALPSGVTLKNNGNGTATLSGTPAAGTAGLYELNLTASNAVGDDSTQNFFLLIGQAPTFTGATSATFGVGGPGSFTVTTPGSPAPTLTESGSLPGGLSFTDNGDGTATLSGTPAAGSDGTYKLTLTANNGIGPNVTRTLTVTVAGQAPAITSGSSDTFTVGTSSTFTLTASGSPTASLTESGALPNGVSFTANGASATLKGMPAAGSAGTYPIVITAANGTSSSATQNFTFKVDDAPRITSAASTAFVAGGSNSFTVTTYGFPAPSLAVSGTLPSGISFKDNGNGTATLSGTAAVGSYGFMLTANNGIGSEFTQSFTLTVGSAQAPTITSAAGVSLTVGHAGNFFKITSTGLPTASLTEAGGLPQGVTFTDNGNGTATISGTPAAGTSGNYTLAITAANGNGAGATQYFHLTIKDASQITSAADATFALAEANEFTVTTYGLPAPALSESGVLPTGVTFTDNGNGTATIAGKPADGTLGIYNLTITANNGIGTNAIQNLTLTVAAGSNGFVFESTVDGTFAVGQKGSFTIDTFSSSSPYKLSETGALPTGVKFTDNGNGTATVSGTPAAGTGGIYDYTVTASGGPDDTFTQGFVLYVEGPPTITSAATATFFANEFGSFNVTTQGLPSAAVIESGALPSGVTISGMTLSGTPEPGTAGTYPITFTAQNSQGTSTTQNFMLIVAPAPGSVITFTENQLGSATVASTLTGTPKLTETGNLPSGVTFTDNGDGTGTISGSPLPATGGKYLFTVTATGTTSSQTQSFILDVDAPPAITSKSSAFFTLSQFNEITITSTGFPGAELTESGALPQGVSFFDFGSSGNLFGTPAAGTAGTYNITFTAQNGVGSEVTQNFTLLVGTTPSISFGIVPTFTVGQEGSFTATTSDDNPLTLSENGSLPQGVTFADNGNGTATLAGVPASGSGGNYLIFITASNGITQTTQPLSLTVTAPPTFSSNNSTTFVPAETNSFIITTAFAPTAVTENGALPAGVTFTDNGNGTATLSGMPASGTSGTFNLTLTATNAIGTGTQHFTLTVGPGLAFTSPNLGTLTAGTNGSISISASGTAAPTLTETGTLPTGVSFQDNGGTATLSGIPAAGTGGTYDLVLTAHNGVDADASQSFTLTVDAAPKFTSVNTGGLVVGQSFNSVQFAASGFPAPTITESGTLPSGISFEPTGDGFAILSGEAAANSAGTYHLVLTAKNGIGTNATQDFTLIVGSTPAITSPSPTFIVGKDSSYTVTTSGSPAPSLTLLDNLPAGLTFKDNGNGTATISGTPGAGTGGTSFVDLEAQNAVGSIDRFFDLTIDEGPAITSNANATFVIGQSNSFAVTADGYPAPSLTESGTLPMGLAFTDYGDGTAYFSGNPAPGTAGSYTFTITATDGTVSKVTQSFTLTVDQAAAITSVPATTFTIGQNGSFTITAVGSPKDLLTAVGALPAGVTFKDNGNDTATLTGTPAAGTAGAYLLTLTAQNGVALNGSQDFILFINPATAKPSALAESAATPTSTLGESEAPAITSADKTTFTAGQDNAFTITTIGYPAATLTANALPEGVALLNNGDGTATLKGRPAARGTFSFTITASDGVLPDSTQTFTLTVA